MHLGRHAVLVAAEIDHPQHPLVTAAAMPGRDAALVVAAAVFFFGTHQALFRLGAARQVGKIADRGPAAARSHWLIASNAHD